MTVTPGTASVTAGGTQAFTAVVAGAVNQAVTWSVQETSGGTVSADRPLHRPSTAGTYHVRAISVADPTKMGTAIVTVTLAADVARTLPATMPARPGLRGARALVAVNGHRLYAVGRDRQSDIGGSIYGPRQHRSEVCDITVAQWYWYRFGGIAILLPANGFQVGTGLYRIGGTTNGGGSGAVNSWQEFNALYDSSYTGSDRSARRRADPSRRRVRQRALHAHRGRRCCRIGSAASAETWTGIPPSAGFVAPMTIGRSGHSVAVVGNKLYAIGGERCGTGRATSRAWRCTTVRSTPGAKALIFRHRCRTPPWPC